MAKKKSEPRAHVVVKCVFCKKTKKIGPGEVAPGDMPMCECGGVMVAEKAEVRL